MIFRQTLYVTWNEKFIKILLCCCTIIIVIIIISHPWGSWQRILYPSHGAGMEWCVQSIDRILLEFHVQWFYLCFNVHVCGFYPPNVQNRTSYLIEVYLTQPGSGRKYKPHNIMIPWKLWMITPDSKVLSMLNVF